MQQKQVSLQVNLTQLKDLANLLVANLSLPKIILLEGPLGSGKTQFVKFFAKKIGVKETIISPTFIKMTRFPFQDHFLVHLDGYNISEKQAPSFLDYLEDDLVFIEWPEVFLEYLPNTNLTKIKFLSSKKEIRKITLESSNFVVQQIKEKFNVTS